LVFSPPPAQGTGDKKQTKLTLGLKIVQGRTVGASVSASNILAFGGALSLNLGLGAAYATTVETQFVSVFPGDIRRDVDRDAACKTKARMGNGIGLEEAVLALVKEVNKAQSVRPHMKSESLKYTVSFGVTREAKFGADFAFVPVKLSASDQKKREDVQTITFEGYLGESLAYAKP
jgi:hypothetical protein